MLHIKQLRKDLYSHLNTEGVVRLQRAGIYRAHFAESLGICGFYTFVCWFLIRD